MALETSQMTFFYSHSSIDDKHAKDVEQILLKVCRSEADWNAVEETAIITLDLTVQILSAVIDEYQKLVKGEPAAFAIVNDVMEVTAV